MKFSLFILLIILNIILRVPSVPHEYGIDSFVIHILANSISRFGSAEWWVRPESIFGWYPYSEPSAVPFILSGISQSTGIDMEKVILLFCVILGLLSIFAAYILAGKIIDDDLFKFLVAFAFSTSPAILNYLTWTITARAPFIALLPIFTYLLIKCHDSVMRYSLLTLIFTILLFSTHHLAYFLIPIFIGYIIAVIFYKLKTHIKFVKLPKNFDSFVLVTAFLIMFAIPFKTGHIIEVGSRYQAVMNIFLDELPRYVGVLYIFSVGGLTYLLFKPNKKFGEWSLLLILIFIAPILYAETYMKWFVPCFALLLSGISLINIAKLYEQKKKYVILIIVIFLLLSVSFSGFYQHWRTHGFKKVTLFEGYMKEKTYIAGLWAKENIKNGLTISNDWVLGPRIFAVSGVPLLTGYDTVDQAYGLVNVSELKLEKRSITSDEFYYQGPYKIISIYQTPEYFRLDIMRDSYEYYESRYRSRFNFTHVIENKKIRGSFAYHGVQPSKFLNYIYNKKDYIYDNGRIGVWFLN